MKSGPKYAIRVEGLIKLLVLVLGCIAFSLYAASDTFSYTGVREWVFASYIVAWSVSLLFYFFRVTGLAQKMDCGGGCTYDGFDFLWSWISAIIMLATSIAFAFEVDNHKNLGTKYDLQVGSVCMGFATSIAYAVEAFFLKSYAPSNAGYIATPKGWFKTGILILATATFSLLVDSNYDWCIRRSCSDAVTYSLAAYCIAWGVALILFFSRMFLPERISDKKGFTMFEFGWSALSALLFITASSCFAAFMNCSGKDFENNPNCQKRLTGVILGFVTGVLFVVDAFMSRPKN